MAIVLIPGTNTFVTLEEADLYFSDQLGGESWTVLDEDTKNKSLATAYSRLTAFCTFSFAGESAPDNVKIAQSEYALALQAESISTTVAGEAQLKKMKGGPAELEFFELDGDQGDQEAEQYIKSLLNSDCCDCFFPSASASIGKVFV